jgi:hypothetical protein
VSLAFHLSSISHHGTEDEQMSERQKQHQGKSAGDESDSRNRDLSDTDIAAEPKEQRESRRGRGNLDEMGEPTTAAIPDPNDLGDSRDAGDR